MNKIGTYKDMIKTEFDFVKRITYPFEKIILSMKTTASQTFSQEVGALYSDILSQKVYFRVPGTIQLKGEEQDSPCVYDMVIGDVLMWNMLYQDEVDFTIKVPTSAVNFIEVGSVNYENLPRPLYRIEPA